MIGIILLLFSAICLIILAIRSLYCYSVEQHFKNGEMATYVFKDTSIIYSRYISLSLITKESKKEEIQRAKEYIKEIKRLEKL